MPDLTDLRAAVVGTGFIGVVHVDALRRLGVEVLGVVGSSPERARSDAETMARLRELQPLTGGPGRPEDVAGAAVYLASAPFVTGAVLSVDGGWTAR